MSKLLSDLFAHQAWADAEQWKAFEAFPKIFEDNIFFERLHHLHLVQQGFLAVCRKDRTYRPTHAKDFVNASSLKVHVIQLHKEAIAFVASLSEAQLEIPAVIPWFNDPPLHLTVERALTQCVMHSQYHRGQNALRLRAAGGEPPPTDLIVWYSKGQPEARWT